MKRLSIKIKENAAGRTAESVITHELKASATYLRRLKTMPQGITVNGEHARSTYRLSLGDELSIQVSDSESNRPAGKAQKLDILYEDEWLIIINKPAGMAVHSSTNEPELNTAEDALYAYLYPDERPHPVSRLDRGTTGAMTVAKCGYMHALMKDIMNKGLFKKRYLAILSRVPEKESGIISAPIGMAENSHYKRAVCDSGAEAISEYRVISAFNGMALAELIPHTGRTHQLRVHMAHIGCPLLGDWLYGEKSALIARPALHAQQVEFTHPLSGETVTVSAPLPEDMGRVLGKFNITGFPL